MIRTLHLSDFKCFEQLSLPCENLTVLTGFNGAGKSTALQTLLLLAQTVRLDTEQTQIPLNGSLACLGTPADVLRERANGNQLLLGIESDEAKITWNLQTKNRQEGHSLSVRSIDILTAQGQRSYHPEQMQNLLPTDASVPKAAKKLVTKLRHLVFLSATRLGAAEVFPIPTETQSIELDVGLQGEFAPWWWLQSDLEDIEIARHHLSTDSPIPRIQLNAWADELFPEVEFNVQPIPQTNLTRLEIRFGSTAWRRPANIGYGLAYVFPVLVLGLLAKQEQIIVIDSPEAHLHPMGQSRIGYFLAKMAAAGVQIMIETHSDHVLNGIRLAVRDTMIQPEQVAVHFFTHRADSPVVSSHFNAQGDLSDWPDGFFDQADKDLARLAGWV